MKKLVTSKVAGLWLMDLLKFTVFAYTSRNTYFQGAFNDYSCYFQVSFSATSDSFCEYPGTLPYVLV